MTTKKSVLRTSIGKKALMAASGLLLFGFILGHLAGNLLIFAGPDAINSYAQHLLDLSPLLWAARIVLLTAVLAHILTSIFLTIENREARPVSYAYKTTIETTYAARTMMISGILLLAFIIFHLLHFTFRVTHPAISNLTDSSGRHDVYSMVVLSFQKPAIAFTYVGAMFILCSHLSHGISSALQSLGWNNERTVVFAKRAGAFIAFLIFIGYVSIPIAALSGHLAAGGIS